MSGKTRGERWEGGSPLSFIIFLTCIPCLLNCQSTQSRQLKRGICCGESCYIDLCFRLWKLQQAGLYWRKSNQQTCSQATDWSVILTETQQRMGSCTTSPQRALYLGELCVMRCGVHYVQKKMSNVCLQWSCT